MKHAKRFALLALVLFMALGAAAALSLSKLRTEYSMRQFLPTAHPLLLADDKVKARFQLSELEPFFALVSIEKGHWLDSGRIEKLKSVTESLKDQDGVNRAVSLANVEGASNTKDGLTVGKLLELTPEYQWKKRVMEDPMLSPNLITADGKTALVLVGVNDISTEKSQAIQKETRKRLQEAFPDSKVHLGGIPAVQVEMGAVLGEELKNFLGLSVLASIVTLLLFFRSVSSVIVPMILMVLANMISLAWMVWTGVSFTVLSTTLPVLVSITVVSMCAHTMLRYASDWELAKRSQPNPNPIRVLFHSYRGLLLANFLTAVSTSIGFFAIALANIPLVRQYGLTVGASIFVCWFVVIGALLPLLILFPVPEVRKWTEQRARWALWITVYKKEILVAVAVVACVFFYKGKNLNWSARLFDDLPAQHEARATTTLVDEKMGGMIPLDLIIENAEENAWNDPDALAKLDSLAVKWRKDPRVGSVSGASDLLRAAGRVQGKDLPKSRQEAAEYGFLYGFSGANPLKSFVTADGRATRLYIRLRDIPADQMKAAVTEFEVEAQNLFPGWKVNAAGMATTVHELNNELSEELIYGFWQALALIGLFLLVCFRSLRWTLVSILPNLLPAVILLGALNFCGTPIKPGIALIFSIALGISFDNTVYLLGRLKLLKDRTGKISVEKAWYQEGNLCLFSSMALSAGFMVFLASYFSLNQQFGAYMLVSIVAGLVGDLILLPAMLAAFPWMVKDKKSKEEKFMPDKAVAAGIALTLFVSGTLYAATSEPTSAKAILDKVEKNVNSQDEVATVKMTITEPDGTKKDRALEIRRKGQEDKQKVLVKMQSPADLKGTSLLSVSKGKSSDQWLYLPSSKQTRRILSSNKSSNFMDSELSYEDMGTSSDAKFESKILKTESEGGHKFTVIENTPKGESSYGKIHLWVDQSNYLVGKMEYFDKSMKLLKVSNFSGYKQYDKGVWRAQKIQVANVQNKRGTVLELSDLKLNKGLPDDEFTESALTEGD